MNQRIASVRRSSSLLAALIGFMVLFATLSAGYAFVSSAWTKWNDPAWTGHQAGTALSGFITSANQKAVPSDRNPRPDVLPATRNVNNGFFTKHARLFAWMVALGELCLPIALFILLCIRFRGSRQIALAVAGLAALLNLTYMFEGSAGLNPPMLFMWLTVLWSLAALPAAALFYAVDLSRATGREPAERPHALDVSAGQWVFFAINLLIIGIGAWVMYPARTVAILALASVLLAALLYAIKSAVSQTAHGARHAAARRKRGAAPV